MSRRLRADLLALTAEFRELAENAAQLVRELDPFTIQNSSGTETAWTSRP